MVKVLHILGGSLNSGAGKEVKILNEKINKETKIVSSIFNEKKIFNLTLSELKKRNILIIDSKIGINKSYLKIKKKLRL